MKEQSASFLIKGANLGPYRIVRLIGEGGMGEVYEAYDEVLNRRAALKVISPKIKDHSGIVKMFVREGQALARVSHPNVVAVYTSGETRGIHYLAMEYIDGKALDEYVAGRKLTSQEALPIFRQILDAVRTLHENGVIHRDLKPKNVIITKDKIVKIVDFGIAKIGTVMSRDANQNGLVVGSIHYMAPEIIRGDAASPLTDMWSIGMIFYELLTGERPFAAESRAEIEEKIKYKDLTFPKDMESKIPEELRLIIQTMCMKTPNRRYESIDQVLAKIKGLQKGGKRAQDINLEDSKIIRREPAPTWKMRPAVTGVAISILTAAGIWFWQNFASLKNTKLKQVHEPAPVLEVRAVATPPPPLPPPAPMPSPVQAEATPIPSLPATPPPEPVVVKPAPTAQVVTAVVKPVDKTANRPSAVTPPPPAAAPPAKKQDSFSSKAPEAPEIRKLQQQAVLQLKKGMSERKPASNALLNPPTLSWKKSKNAVAYELEVSKSSDFSKSADQNEVLKKTDFNWSLPKPGTFFWRVRGLASKGEKGSWSRTGKVELSLPAPALQKTISRQISVENPEDLKKPVQFSIAWTPVPMASFYKVMAAQNEKFSSPFLDQKVDKATVKFPILNDGTYYLRVAAVDESGNLVGAYSETSAVSIHRQLGIATPKPKLPPNGISIVSLGSNVDPIVFRWDKVAAAEAYSIEISSDKAFKQIVHSANLSEAQLIVSQELPKGRLFWRVRSERGEQKSAWSAPYFFER